MLGRLACVTHATASACLDGSATNTYLVLGSCMLFIQPQLLQKLCQAFEGVVDLIEISFKKIGSTRIGKQSCCL